MKSIFFVFFIALGSITLIFSSCSEKPKVVNLNLSYISSNSKLSKRDALQEETSAEKIRHTAEQIDDSINKLSNLSLYTKQSAEASELEKILEKDLNGRISVEWHGQMEQLLAAIAKGIGYKYRSLGKKPTIPILIDIEVSNTPIANVLLNIAYQASEKAKIGVYPSNKLIEVGYISS